MLAPQAVGKAHRCAWRPAAIAQPRAAFSHCPLIFSLYLLQSPDADDVTIAVALSDAGEFAAAHPQGRALAASTGLKDAVLLHLEAKRKSLDDVKQQALMAMSKLIKA